MLQSLINFEPLFDFEDSFRAELVATLKPFDRGWFAEQIEKKALRKCSTEIIDRWTSDRNAPGFLIPTICEVSQNPALAHFIIRPIQALLNKNRLEELSHVKDELRRLQLREMELEGRSNV